VFYGDWINYFTGPSSAAQNGSTCSRMRAPSILSSEQSTMKGSPSSTCRTPPYGRPFHLGLDHDFVPKLIDATTALKMCARGRESLRRGVAQHPYKAATWEEVTGRLHIEDHLWDLQLAQRRILAPGV